MRIISSDYQWNMPLEMVGLRIVSETFRDWRIIAFSMQDIPNVDIYWTMARYKSREDCEEVMKRLNKEYLSTRSDSILIDGRISQIKHDYPKVFRFPKERELHGED